MKEVSVEFNERKYTIMKYIWTGYGYD